MKQNQGYFCEDYDVVPLQPHERYRYYGIVHPSGYVLHPDDVDSYISKALASIKRGGIPMYMDNSRYVHVDPVMTGQQVILIDTNDEKLVFSLDGTAIPSQTDTPLAYVNWGCHAPSLDDFDEHFNF